METQVTFKGNPITLVGGPVKVGDRAPEFTVIDGQLKEFGLKNFRGMIKLISVTPSLDTPLCDTQARRFNEDIGSRFDGVVVMNISMDLPFAISRFCSAAGIRNIMTFSDHRDASFGAGYGVLIKEFRLLARSVFIIDRSDTVRYVEIVREITEPPDYKGAISAVKKLISA